MSDQNPVPVRAPIVIGLAIYLGLAAILAGCFVYSLWNSNAATEPIPLPRCDGVTKAALQHVYPASLSFGLASKILLVGCQFPENTHIKVNGAQHSSTVEDGSHIGVPLSATDVASIGTSTITLSDQNGEFAFSVLNVDPPMFHWRVLGLGSSAISQEVQLLLLVICMGTFSSSVYACKSLADFEGEGKLYEQWILYYLIQPLEGAGIALLFYLVIRGGFLAGAGADAKSVNQFGMSAIAGLAGAFSDIAFMKLREVFQTLFKPQDDRGGKLTPLKIVTTTLSTGRVGIAYSQPVQASNGVPPLKWSVTPQLPAGLAMDIDTGAITGTPSVVTAPNKYKITVKDNANPVSSATAELILEITG